MKNTGIRKLVASAAIVAATMSGTLCHAENPIIQTKFTADPAPLTHGDTVYLITSHDEDDATSFKMFNWMCYSTKDMVNWTDHGIIGGVREPYKTFKWADGVNAWAPQCVERNGKFYLYCPFPYKGKMAIGVAVADKPTGPFVDAIGKPLISRGNGGDYDPTVFVDDDGQAYMYWGGNGPCYYVKLNADMISVSGDIQIASIDFEGTPREASYTEGPWQWKKNGHYYLAWASRCCPEGIGYAMSDKPTGPWKCLGTIMDPNRKSSGNHPGICELKGKSYVFGFNYAVNFALTNKHRERRSVCVEEMTYNANGTIQKHPWWSTNGVAQVGTFNPYAQTEAATICWENGIKTTNRGEGKSGVYVTATTNGAYIKLKGVDFGGKGAGKFIASVASTSKGGVIELRLDSETGLRIGKLQVKPTGGLDKWETQSCSVRGAKGIHDLYLKFTGDGSSLMNFDWWKCEPKKRGWF
ncbi:MAG TPA: family 43 glycosylhydrolase [Candidatus Paceibacterota bacterium]|nr:family 43 glycosylhydrolase [Candidatus Paceibacterota bacterium]